MILRKIKRSSPREVLLRKTTAKTQIFQEVITGIFRGHLRGSNRGLGGPRIFFARTQWQNQNSNGYTPPQQLQQIYFQSQKSNFSPVSKFELCTAKSNFSATVSEFSSSALIINGGLRSKFVRLALFICFIHNKLSLPFMIEKIIIT